MSQTTGLSADKLALLLLRMKKAGKLQEASRIPRREPGEAPVLSFAQERLWLLDRLEPGSSAYNMPFPARLKGRLEVAALAATLSRIVARHEALRTAFPETGGEPGVAATVRLDPVQPVGRVARARRRTRLGVGVHRARRATDRGHLSDPRAAAVRRRHRVRAASVRCRRELVPKRPGSRPLPHPAPRQDLRA